MDSFVGVTVTLVWQEELMLGSAIGTGSIRRCPLLCGSGSQWRRPFSAASGRCPSVSVPVPVPVARLALVGKYRCPFRLGTRPMIFPAWGHDEGDGSRGELGVSLVSRKSWDAAIRIFIIGARTRSRWDRCLRAPSV